MRASRLAALVAVIFSFIATAQESRAQPIFVLATCGTVPASQATLTAGMAGMTFVDTDGKLCVNATVSASITFPTVGAAVPGTAVYNGINVAGTLRGWSGLSTGSIFPGAVAIVDASGNQVTSFGGSNASVSATAAAVPASATYLGVNSGGTLVGLPGDVTNGAFVNVKTSVLPTGASTAANQATAIASLATIATNTGAAIPAGSSIIGKVGIDQSTPGTTNGVQVNAALPAGTNTIGTAGQLPYPVGATPYTATATGTTGATTATLAGASSVTTYLCGFSIRANATAAATGNATVTGVITATMNFTQWTAPNASGLGVTEMIFAPCIPASATNTSVAVVSAAPGTGGVVSVTAWGYKL